MTLVGSSLTGCQTALYKGKPREFQVRQVWVKQQPEMVNLKFRKLNRMKPLLYNGLVIQGNAIDGMFAVDQITLKEKWRLKILNGVEAPALLFKGRVYFGALDGQFYSVDAETGKVFWTYPFRTETLAEPILYDGVIYVLAGNNTVYALDAATGAQKWLYSRQDPASLSIRGGSRPIVKNNLVVLGLSEGSVVALTADTGLVKWEKQLNRNKKFKDLDSDLLLDGEFIYVLGYDDAIYSLRAATGEVAWRTDVGGYGAPLVKGDRLFVSSTEGSLLALEKDTGKKIWEIKTTKGIFSSPVAFNGSIVTGESAGSLFFINPQSGKKLGEYQPGKGVHSTATVNEKENHVYFMSVEANLFKLEAAWKDKKPFPYLR